MGRGDSYAADMAEDSVSVSAGEPSEDDTGTSLGDDALAARLTVLARDLQGLSSPQEVLDRIVTEVVRMVPGAEDATITIAERRRSARSAAASSNRAALFDKLQSESGEGPCLDTLFEQETVRVADLSTDMRWPKLAGRVEELGARSIVCFQLFVTGDNTLGSLDVLATPPNVFTDESEHIGLLFASHAAIALADAQELQGVRSALLNRDVIGQAKGIYMERYKINADEAFVLLRRHSQMANRKLVEVAQALARSIEG
ncbi:MAG: GAF and ANTAR domain-containing protein [Actinobacteria bacterium]|nr:GAF and ANTAR domain-containing protein [Actinomycetota bacterium]MCA1722433.1 GAF and ANTAR domain-containing protein [Actinomycetota bacterium]